MNFMSCSKDDGLSGTVWSGRQGNIMLTINFTSNSTFIAAYSNGMSVTGTYTYNGSIVIMTGNGYAEHGTISGNIMTIDGGSIILTKQ